jgi:benzoate/toluate 1,2-dioxygenase beta subunit
VLQPGRRVLDARLGGRRRAHPRPAARDLAGLLPGLEDRVFRIRTDRSSATSLPEPRTGHNITDVEITGRDGDAVDVRFNWFTLYYRYQTTDTYFGTSFYRIDLSGPEPLIVGKKVVLKNDYVHHVVDIYHV